MLKQIGMNESSIGNCFQTLFYGCKYLGFEDSEDSVSYISAHARRNDAFVIKNLKTAVLKLIGIIVCTVKTVSKIIF